MLATLLCLVVFKPEAGCMANGAIGLTAAGDNQSNGFTLDRFSTTKYPLYLVLMEVAEHLRRKSLMLSVAWRPRDENEEADALTNQVFEAFDASRRLPVFWDDLELFVLPELTQMAEGYFNEVQTRKKEAKDRAGAAQGDARKRARGTLCQLDPW